MTTTPRRHTSRRRLFIGLLVVGFWLTMTGLLIYRDVLGGVLRTEVVLNDEVWIEEPVETWLVITTGPTLDSADPRDQQQVGWARVRQAPEDRNEIEGALMEAEVHLQLNLLGRATALDMEGTAWRARRLKQAEIDFRITSGEAEFALAGTILGDRLQAQVQSGSETSPFDVRLPDNALFSTGFGTSLAFPALQPGEETVVQTFDPMTLRPTRSRVRAVSRDRIEIGGETIRAVRLRVQASGLETIAWIDDHGQVIRAETPLGLHLQKATREQALTPIGDDPNVGELLRITAVRPSGAQPRRGATRLLATLRSDDGRTLTIEHGTGVADIRDDGVDAPTDWAESAAPAGSAELAVPGDFRQRPSEGERVLLLPGDAPLNDAEARPSEEQLVALLGADPFIAAEHPRIRAQAESVLAEAGVALGETTDDRRAMAFALHDWAFRHIEKVPVLSLPSALEVLESRRGDCNEHTILYTAMARSIGLPTRVAIGLVWSDELRGFYYHAWPEIWLGDRWLATDPTLGQRVADATHIKLLEGGIERWPQLLPFLGKLEIELHSVDTSPVDAAQTPSSL